MAALQPAPPEQSAPATRQPHRHYNPSLIYSEVPQNQKPITETLKTELHWRQLTGNPATEVVIAGPGSDKYFEIGQSTPNRIVITLPYAFLPTAHIWPVQGCIVALVETGCYERELIEVCQRAGAKYIECHGRTMQEPYIVTMDYAARMAA